MGLAKSIKPISYLKSHAAEIANTLHESGEPLIITQNGEAKLVVMDIYEYERQQEALALLKLAIRGKQQIDNGQCKPAKEVVDRLRKRLKNK